MKSFLGRSFDPTKSLESHPMLRLRFLPLICIAGALCGCVCVNKPLNPAEVPIESRVLNHTRADVGADVAPTLASAATPEVVPASRPAENTQRPLNDGLFVGLALSGGGSRSANFSAACMFELQRLGLLKHVNYVSSVSGGSLTGAYFCCSGDGDGGWNPAEVQRRLTHSFATDMIVALFEPWNLAAMAFSDWSRSDLLAQSLRDNLFTRNGHELTFADLRPDRPRLLINSTDLQSGRSFIFCNQSFDQINSDLAKFPIAYAVAASASVPVILHQITLEDYSTIFKQYRHLIDGGVVDNLGVTSLLETYDAQEKSAQSNGRPDPYPNGVVLFVIDAQTNFDAHLSDRQDISLLQSLAYGASLTSTALINRASSATLAQMILRYSPDNEPAETLRKEIAELENDGHLVLKDNRGKPVRIVAVALRQLSTLSNVPFGSFYEQVNSIATYFNISQTEAYDLYKAAQLLMRGKLNAPLRDIASQFHETPTTLPDETP
jgi:predicted acylesterase/phospholipase RssA